MPGTNGDPGATPAVPGATPDSTPDPQPAPPPATGAAGAQDGSPPDLGDAGKAAIERERESRREAEKALKASQSELRKLQEARQAAEDAKLSEQERIAKRLAEAERRNSELERQLRESRLRSAVFTAAQRLSDEPEILLALLDRDALEWAPDGTPKDLERHLGAIVEAHPKLARSAPDFGGGTRGATPSGTDMNAWIRQAAKRT
jgi:hypothetical protein